MAFVLLAHAEPPPSIRRPADEGVIDWTAGALEVTAKSQAQTGAWRDRKLQEQDALDHMQPLVTDALRGICVAKGATGEDLMALPGDRGLALADGVKGWDVVETRYFQKGGVEMDARIDLAKWLGPVRSKSALATKPGIIVDARGLDVTPCLYPALEVADAASIWSAPAPGDTLPLPALFVSDPADPRALARTGADPVTVRAIDSGKGSLSIDAASAARITGDLAAARVLVVVVDP